MLIILTRSSRLILSGWLNCVVLFRRLSPCGD